jgi:hypothetical protein
MVASHEKVGRYIAYKAHVGVTLYGIAAPGTLLSFYCDAIFVEYTAIRFVSAKFGIGPSWV